jgi:uncharacterized protein YjdB
MALIPLTVAGCGGGGGAGSGGSPTPVSVTVSPATATLAAGASKTFVANVANSANLAVTWRVQEGPAGGSVTSAGVYTAPAAAGTYHVIATSLADQTKTGSATIKVSAGGPPVSVTVSPNTATLVAGTIQPFTAAVSSTANTAVTWSIQEGAAGGSISAQGSYTAPSTAGTYHVVATSVADPTKSAAATVTVQIGVSISPASKIMSVRDSRTFTATVAGSAIQAVTWSVQEGAAGGTISQAGVYVAPASAGIYHIVATSQADSTKTAVAIVTVQSGGASGTIQ